MRYHKFRHFDQLLGKTLSAVVAKKGQSEPRWQLFLVYDDDTHFEIYVGEYDWSVADGLREGGVEAVKNNGRDDDRRIVYEANVESGEDTGSISA